MNGYHNFNNDDSIKPQNNIKVQFLKCNEVKSFTQVAFLSKLRIHEKLDSHKSKFKRKYLKWGPTALDSNPIVGKENNQIPTFIGWLQTVNGEINLVFLKFPAITISTS